MVSATSRREFLRAGAALPVLSLAGVPFEPSTAGVAAAETLVLERFLFDVRFAESGAVAEHVERCGVPVTPIADDLMSLWYDELDVRWRQKPMAIAGVTLAEALFVLETFALDRGMHVVFRGEHGLVEAGRIRHRLAGPAVLVEALTPLPEDWERALAEGLTRCPLGAPATARVELESVGRALSLRDMPLHSWIIAPRAAVRSLVGS